MKWSELSFCFIFSCMIAFWGALPLSHASYKGRGGEIAPGTFEFTRLDSWLDAEYKKSIQGLLQNISPSGSVPGVVIASPSWENPDYYYHWVRDAALVMDVVVNLFERANGSQLRGYYSTLISDYVEFSRKNQLTPNRSGGLGEPKFNIDGSAFSGDWGRPQNDGPALRAITLTRFAFDLLQEGTQDAWVHSKLYDGRLPSNSLIKTDLEYISHHWKDSSFDLWEEVQGQHFYTRMVQRKALLQGANLADRLGDTLAGVWYRQQARLLEIEIQKHWSASRGYILATLESPVSDLQKPLGLDVAVVLGVLHGSVSDSFFSPLSDQVQASVLSLRIAFQNAYSINSRTDLGPAIGRYPEDTYNGYTTNGSGNPWVLATLAFSEYYTDLASQLRDTGRLVITPLNLPFFRALNLPLRGQGLWVGQTLRSGDPLFVSLVSQLEKEAEGFLSRVKYHCPAEKNLSEQINRDTGFMQGAPDLSWSYASLITAYWKRNESLFGFKSH